MPFPVTKKSTKVVVAINDTFVNSTILEGVAGAAEGACMSLTTAPPVS